MLLPFFKALHSEDRFRAFIRFHSALVGEHSGGSWTLQVTYFLVLSIPKTAFIHVSV